LDTGILGIRLGIRTNICIQAFWKKASDTPWGTSTWRFQKGEPEKMEELDFHMKKTTIQRSSNIHSTGHESGSTSF
jgi:hypothetical protein